ncbi:MAG TPA: hypothetical protein VK832_13480 [Burkholderiaceae bacterium]|nr:hypothetical protein [Burkholderiaceae bacterium]
MGKLFWIKRFFTVAAIACAVISIAQWLKGNSLYYSIEQGLIWGAASAAVFTGSRIYRSGKGQHCAICNDIPDVKNGPGTSTK